MQMGVIATQGRTKLQQARVWLVLRLLDNGPELVSQVIVAGATHGFNKTLLKRAGKGIIRHKHERRFGGPWYWELMPQMESEGVNDYREALVKKLLEATQ